MNASQVVHSLTLSSGLDSQQTSRLEELLEQYLKALEQGRAFDREAMFRAYPDLAEHLRANLAKLAALHHAAAGIGEGQVTLEEFALGRFPEIRQLGDFRILRQIGRGGMGVVYEAEQLSLQRKVALKVLPFAAVLDDRQLQRFRSEALAAASLEHPHIVNVFYVGNERGVHFYAMRYVDGQSLAQVISRLRQEADEARGDPLGQSESATGKRLGSSGSCDQATSPRPQTVDPSTASAEALQDETRPMAALPTAFSEDRRSYYRAVARIGIEIAEALEYAHQMGIVHRDIKPSNLLLDSNAGVWVTDFGLAATRNNTNFTMSGDLLGTLRYMSPEQASGRRGVTDHRTDIYGLGATLYELLTLRPAMDGDDRQTILRQIDQRDPRPPRSIDANIPRDLETIILKSLAKLPEDRYSTCSELASDLRCFLESRPIRARRTTRAEHVWRWSKRNPLFAALSATLLLVMAFLSIAGPLVVIEQRQLIETERRLSERTRRQNYSLSMAAAYNAYYREETDRILGLLEQQIPDPGQTDLRGFESLYLLGRLQRAVRRPKIISPANVDAIAFEPNSGSYIAAACQDGVVRLWDCKGFALIHEFQGHEGWVVDVDISPSGQVIASVGEDGYLRLWDPERLVMRAQSQGHNSTVTSVRFLPDSQTLLTAGRDGNVVVWDVRQPEHVHPIKTIRATETWVMQLSVSPDGQRVAAGSADGTVKIWSLPSGELEKTLPIDGFMAYSVAFAPEGKDLLAIGNVDISLWRTSDWTRIGRLYTANQTVRRLDFSPDGKLLVAPVSGRLWTWDVDVQRRVESEEDPLRCGGAVRFSPDGQQVAAAHEAHIELCRNTLPRDRKTASAPPDTLTRAVIIPNRANGVLFVTKGQCLSPSGVGSVGLYDMDSLEPYYVRTGLSPVLAVACCPARPDLVAVTGGRRGAEANGHVDLVELDTGQVVASLTGSPGQGYALAFSPDGRMIASAPQDKDHPGKNFIDVWDVSTGQLRYTFAGLSVDQLVFAPDNQTLIAAGGYGRDAQVRLYDAKHGCELFALAGRHRRNYSSIGLTEDGRHLVSGGWRGGITLWNLADRKEEWSVYDLGNSLMGICFSPDNKTVAAGGSARRVKLFAAETGDELGTLTTNAAVISLCFSDDGKTLVAGCYDGTVVFWHDDGRRRILYCE